ncbi:DsbA family protein [Kribbella sp. NPDC055071]
MGDLMNELALYTDPACPWCWLAVRWIAAVAPARHLRIQLRPYSLWLRDGGTQAPPPLRDIAVATSKQSLRLMRIFVALHIDDRDSAIEPLYLAWGKRVFVPGPPQAPAPAVLAESVAAAGLEGSWLAAADDPQWDRGITCSMAELDALVDGTAVLPTMADGQRILFRGAVLAAPVTHDHGLELWDALELLTSDPSFVALSPALPFPIFAVDNSDGGTAKSVKLMG